MNIRNYASNESWCVLSQAIYEYHIKDFILSAMVDDTSKAYQYLCEIRKTKTELIDRMIAEYGKINRALR